MAPAKEKNYTIELVTESDRENVINFLKTFFFKDEPLNKFLKLISEERPRCLDLEKFALASVNNGVCVKAVYQGKIIGLSINAIVDKDETDTEKKVEINDPLFIKIVKLLEHVVEQGDMFSHFPGSQKAIDVSIISVNNEYRGQGIAKELLAKTRDLGRERGCDFMVADCTSHFTAMALKRLGFECIYSLNYSDYKVDGEVVFKPEPPHDAVTIYAQKINNPVRS